MPKHPSRLELKALHNAFLALERPADLAAMLETDELYLFTIAAAPAYETFFVPKRNGEQRLIEDPAPPLKKIQRNLNEALQAVYYFHRTDAAYGFLTACADDEPHQHRNIISNARSHMGRPWMLNMDVEDFFHYVPDEKVAWIFLSRPFTFDDDLARMLMMLTTLHGRLPMGAPTSPVLSNFAARLLDEDLLTLARSRQWIYTRYADDMTFSSRTEITQADIQLLQEYYLAHGFEANEKKTKLMGPNDPHSVTGIIVGENRLDLEPGYFEDMNTEIKRLADISATKGRLGITLRDWVNEYADKIEGMISYGAQVLGEGDPRITTARQELAKAISGPKNYGAVSWLDFPYH